MDFKLSDIAFEEDAVLRPDPHPLDFDWRFDRDTINFLIGRIGNSRPLLLGCPSVAEALALQGRRATLVDRQPLSDLPDDISHSRIDLSFDHISEHPKNFQTVVIDSPWYTDYLQPWLEEAHFNAAIGGRILFSLWPASTRPSGGSEAAHILKFAQAIGHVAVEQNVLCYDTPKFELETAAVSGAPIREGWRRGNLVTICVAHESPGLNSPSRHTRASKIWKRYTFDRTQVALRLSRTTQHEPPALVSLVQDNILPDVSRRLAIRPQIDIWTSNNVAFSIQGEAYFEQALDRIADRDLNNMGRPVQQAYNLLLKYNVVAADPIRKSSIWQHLD